MTHLLMIYLSYYQYHLVCFLKDEHSRTLFSYWKYVYIVYTQILYCGVDNRTHMRCMVCVCVCAACQCVPGHILIAWSGPQECRSQCCRHSLWLSSAVQTQLSWQPSGAFWPLGAVSLNFPVSGLWPEEGDGGDPSVAFLPLEEEAVSPGRERMFRVEGRTFTWLSPS